MRPVTVLLLALFIDIVGFGIVVPILPFIVQSMGGSEFAGGLLFAVYAAAAAVCGPLWGRLSDRIGRRRALMATLFGAVCSYLLLGLANSLFMVFVARALSGMMSGNVGVVVAAMADLSPIAQRTRAIALIGVSFGLGFATGPGIAAALAELFGADALSLSGFAAAGLSGCALLLTWRRLPETRPAPGASSPSARAFRPFLDDRWKLLLMAQFTVSAAAGNMVFSMLGFWAEAVRGWSEREVGLLMVGVGLLIAFLQGVVVGPLAARIGEVRTYLLALSVSFTGCLMLLLGPDRAVTPLLAFPLMMGGMTLSYPVLNSLVSQRHGPEVQGAALGLANGFGSLGRVFGPTAAGALMAAYGPPAPFAAAMAVALAGILWALAEIRSGRSPAGP